MNVDSPGRPRRVGRESGCDRRRRARAPRAAPSTEAGTTLQVGGTNVNATDATGVQATGAGDPTQLAENQQGFGTGVGDVGQPSVQLQSGELDTGGGDGPIYADASAPQDPGLGATDYRDLARTDGPGVLGPVGRLRVHRPVGRTSTGRRRSRSTSPRAGDHDPSSVSCTRSDRGPAVDDRSNPRARRRPGRARRRRPRPAGGECVRPTRPRRAVDGREAAPQRSGGARHGRR